MRLARLFALLSLPACFSVNPADGEVVCSTTGRPCPENYHCVTGANVCVHNGSSWTADLSGLPDSGSMTDLHGSSMADFAESDFALPVWTAITTTAGANLYSIWGTSATNIFIVGGLGGTSGDIFHSSDGANFGFATPTTVGSGDLYAVFGQGTRTFVAGAGFTLDASTDGVTWSAMYDNITSFRDLWGPSGGTTTYAVGGKFMLAIVSGSVTGQYTIGAATDSLFGIWGSSATDVWAVGTTLLNTSTPTTLPWTAQTTNVAVSQTYMGIWGSSAIDVYAVGTNGTIIHSTGAGAQFNAQASGTLNTLRGVWGSAANDIYAVGDGGVILHSVGDGTWTMEASSTTAALYAVWGVDANNIYAGGLNTLLHKL